MAKKSSFFRDQWDRRARNKEQEAQPKQPKRSVKALPAGFSGPPSGDPAKDAFNLTCRHAMEYITGALPDYIRRDWPEGGAEHSVAHPEQYVKVDIWVKHKDGTKVAASIQLSKRSLVAGDVQYFRAQGIAIGRQIVEQVQAYSKKDQEPGRLPPPELDWELPTLPYFRAGPGAVIKQQPFRPEKKAEPETGKLGPVCHECGAENRDQFPEWGTCPHGVEK